MPARRWSPTRQEIGHAILLLAVASLLRLVHLGSLSLYGDEDLSAIAVKTMLRDGYPHMPSGLFYVRGLPYTAIAAAFAHFIPRLELALRLPSAIAGILAVPMIYAVARGFVGRGPALLSAWLLALSASHVDMSREGRMYSMFLTTFLFAIWCFDRWIRSGRARDWLGALLAGCFTVLVHELGVLVFFVWALLLYVRGAGRRAIGAAGIMVCACGVIWAVSLMMWRVELKAFAVENTNAGAVSLVRSALHLRHHPTFRLLQDAWHASPWLYALLAAGTLGLAAVWTWREGGSPAARAGRVAGAGFVALAAVLGLFGIAASFLFVLAVLAPTWARAAARSPSVRRAAWLPGAWLAGWLLWGGVAGLALLPGAAERYRAIGGIKPFLLDLFGYPAPHALIYIENMPVMSAIVIAGSVWLLGRRLASASAPRDAMFLPAWMWLPIILTGFTNRFIALRYALPTYPAFVVLDAVTVLAVPGLVARFLRREAAGARSLRAAGWILGAILLVVPVANEWHGFIPAWRAAALDYGQPIPEAFHGFPFHPDHESAGGWVRERLAPGDEVVATDEIVQTVYVGRVDFWLRSARDSHPFSYFQNGSWRSFYTRAPVIETVGGLRAVIDGAGTKTVWVITSSEATGRHERLNPPGLDEFLAAHADRLVYTARDGSTRVYRFTRGPGA